MSDRIFNEDEVQKLIKRAAELEAERSVSRSGSTKNGLTIDELKAVASEAGLDPNLIEKAAFELSDTSDELNVNVRVNREEIASEIWLDHHSDREVMDLLVTELNHIYGTTDELNWWNNLWGTHEGKAKVTRTTGTTEWNYKTEAGIYSTRVLMQQRGERLRFRVSKRQILNMEWDSPLYSLLFVIPVAVILAVIGGLSSSAIFGIAWPGIATGFILSLLGYPLMRYMTKRSVQKHKAEVKNTVRQLSDLVMQYKGLNNSTRRDEFQTKSAAEIEIPDEPEASETQTGKLRNKLKE